MALNARRILSVISRTVRGISRLQGSSATGTRPRGTISSPRSTPTPSTVSSTASAEAYPGDFNGPVKFAYAPSLNGQPDPGEIVWGWVPYEEDHSQGKDRPVLLIGRDGKWLLGLMLTSKDNTSEQHRNDDYVDIGTGDWDRQRRPSEVKVNRVIRLSPASVRREGAILDRERFKVAVDHLNRRR